MASTFLNGPNGPLTPTNRASQRGKRACDQGFSRHHSAKSTARQQCPPIRPSAKQARKKGRGGRRHRQRLGIAASARRPPRPFTHSVGHHRQSATARRPNLQPNLARRRQPALAESTRIRQTRRGAQPVMMVTFDPLGAMVPAGGLVALTVAFEPALFTVTAKPAE